MIVFENNGEIDIEAITTFGVSVKLGDNPIGFFGTGLKYAIAVLLRTGHKVSIWSGDRELRFTTERREVRTKPFDFVLMREGDRLTPMGFTTELGKTWKPWMAYRELYCNARDEGGSVYSVGNPNAASDPRRDQTQIRVEGADVQEVHSNSALYFCEDEPDVVVGGVGIYRRPSQVLFYRGVRVLFLPKPAAFTYNLIDLRIDLTEDRTMTHPFMATWYLSRALARCDDPDILEGALAPAKGALEQDFDYAAHDQKPTDVFLNAVARLKERGQTNISTGALSVWQREVPQQFQAIPSSLDSEERDALRQAKTLCERFEFDVSDVLAVEETPGSDAAYIHGGMIYLLRSRIDPLDIPSLAGDLIRGSMERDGLGQEDRETRLIERLLATAI